MTCGGVARGVSRPRETSSTSTPSLDPTPSPPVHASDRGPSVPPPVPRVGAHPKRPLGAGDRTPARLEPVRAPSCPFAIVATKRLVRARSSPRTPAFGSAFGVSRRCRPAAGVASAHDQGPAMGTPELTATALWDELESLVQEIVASGDPELQRKAVRAVIPWAAPARNRYCARQSMRAARTAPRGRPRGRAPRRPGRGRGRVESRAGPSEPSGSRSPDVAARPVGARP